MLTRVRPNTRSAEDILAAAEAERMTRDANAQRDIRLAEERLRLTREQAQQRRADRRAAREEQLVDRDARRARQQTARKAFADTVRHRFPKVAIGVLAAVPIVAPMIVAWTGQVQIAMKVLHWPMAAGVVFAAAWESVGILAAVLHHLTRSAGDRGTVFRFAAWVCAAGAAAMNYGDRTNHWQPTALAMSYGAMSLVSLAVWELVALFLHRRAQQAAGRVSPPRPHFGFLRWVRFFRLTWTAWSLSLRDDIGTVRAALDAAAIAVGQRDAIRRANAAAKNERKAAAKAPTNSVREPAHEQPATEVRGHLDGERVGDYEPDLVGASEGAYEPAPEPVHERPSRAPRRRLRKARVTRVRRPLLADYVNAAHRHITPDVVVTPAWVRTTTGCSRATATKVVAALQATEPGVTA